MNFINIIRSRAGEGETISISEAFIIRNSVFPGFSSPPKLSYSRVSKSHSFGIFNKSAF